MSRARCPPLLGPARREPPCPSPVPASAVRAAHAMCPGASCAQTSGLEPWSAGRCRVSGGGGPAVIDRRPMLPSQRARAQGRHRRRGRPEPVRGDSRGEGAVGRRQMPVHQQVDRLTVEVAIAVTKEAPGRRTAQRVGGPEREIASRTAGVVTRQAVGETGRRRPPVSARAAQAVRDASPPHCRCGQTRIHPGSRRQTRRRIPARYPRT